MGRVKLNREAATAGRAAPSGESGSGLPAYAPGEAWEEAKKALVDGNFAEAERLRQFMAKSDANLMRERIAEATENAKGDAIK